MTSRPKLLLVRDQQYDPELGGYIMRVADTDPHVIAFTPKPGARTLDWIVGDLLRALGKRREVSGAARNERERLRLAGVWLAAEEIRELIVIGAQELGGNPWRALTDLCVEVGCSLALVVGGPELTRFQREFARDRQFENVAVEEAKQRWPQPADPPSGETRDEAVFPLVPRTHYTTFRANARDRLTPAEFRVVDALFVDTLLHVDSSLPWDGLTVEEMARYLHGLVAGAQTLDQALTQLRATQAACRHHRYLLEIDDARFAAQAQDGSITPLNAEIVNRLRWYQQPRYPAAAVAAITTGLAGWGLETLKVGDVAADGSFIDTVNGERYVPECARPLLRAQLIDRAGGGAGPDDALFGGEAQGRKEELSASGRSLQMLCKKISFETGIRLAGQWNSKEPRAGAAWMERQGIQLRRIEA